MNFNRLLALLGAGYAVLADHGLRFSPFDLYRGSAFIASSIGHFHRRQYKEAATAARKAIQSAPGFSVCYMALAAPLAKLGRVKEAKAAGARLLELQPTLAN